MQIEWGGKDECLCRLQSRLVYSRYLKDMEAARYFQMEKVFTLLNLFCPTQVTYLEVSSTNLQLTPAEWDVHIHRVCQILLHSPPRASNKLTVMNQKRARRIQRKMDSLSFCQIFLWYKESGNYCQTVRDWHAQFPATLIPQSGVCSFWLRNDTCSYQFNDVWAWIFKGSHFY